jgi:hypothetical protein
MGEMAIRILLIIALVWSCGAGLLPESYASESEALGTGDFSLKGFGTLGLARTDTDGIQYARDLSQQGGIGKNWSSKIDTVLGVQAGYQFNDELEGTIQAISRYRYDGSYRPEISWAFLRYVPDPSVHIRAGRLGTEFYMLADSREVGYSYLTVRTPPDYFGTLVFSYFDGVDTVLTAPLGNGLIRGKLFYGHSPEKATFIGDIPVNLVGSSLYGGYLDYLNDPWQFRLSRALV